MSVHELHQARVSRPVRSVSELVALIRPKVVMRSVREHLQYDSDMELYRFLKTKPDAKRFNLYLKGRGSRTTMWNQWLDFLEYAETARHARISYANIVDEVGEWIAFRVHAKKGYSGNKRCCNGTIASWTRSAAKVWSVILGVRYVSNVVTFPGSDWTFEKLMRSLPAYRHKLPKYWLKEALLRRVFQDRFPGGLSQLTLKDCSLDQLVVLALVLAYFGWFRMSEVVRCNHAHDSDLGVAHGGLYWRDFRREVLSDFTENHSGEVAAGLVGWLSWYKNMPVKPGQTSNNLFYIPLFDDADDFSPKPILSLLAGCEIKGKVGELLRIPEDRPLIPDPANPSQNIDKIFVDARVRSILQDYIPRAFWANISTHGPRGGRAQDSQETVPPMPIPVVCQAGRWGSAEAFHTYLANDVLTVFRWTSMLPSHQRLVQA
jgi:hypothetical protein